MNTVQVQNSRSGKSGLNQALADYRAEDNRSVPKYELLKRLLIDYIAALPPEQEFLPYEKDLMERFDVCRSTVSRAMSKLRRSGYIETARKRGSRIIRRTPDETPHPLLTSATGCVGFLLANNAKDTQRSDDIRWQLVDEFERALIPHKISLRVYNLRDNDWQTWRDPQKLVDSLREHGINWVVIRPDSDPQSSLGTTIPYLHKHNIKMVLLFQDLTNFIHNSSSLMPGIDYVTINNHVTISRVLDEYFTGYDLITYIDNSIQESWSASRKEEYKKFAETHHIAFAHISAKAKLLNDADCLAEVDNIDSDTVKKFLKLAAPHQRTACFVANDYTAGSFIRQLKKQGADPRKYAIAGHDNLSSMRTYNLNTFDFDPANQATALIKLLNFYQANPEVSLKYTCSEIIPSRFINRNLHNK